MTYSIVARDPKTGELGVAVQSHYFSVGSVVTWARAGVGAVATQSMVEVSYGPLGLELMSSGKSAGEALDALLKADAKPEVRQVAMVDSRGSVAIHTGKKCIPFAGHVAGEQFSCEANLMSNDTIWGAMEKSYLAQGSLPLPERLVAALEAAEQAGGDIRGRQSAALLVVSPTVSPSYWSGRLVELRVEDHPEPVQELKRLLRLKRGYEWAERGEDFLSSGKFEESREAFARANQLAPEIDELRFWEGVSLLGSGRTNEAKAVLQPIFKKDERWIQVTKSMKQIGMINAGEEVLAQLLSDS
ncbi:MAG TPA: DUF1028 domain-containing protein [Nitrososphaerales archaeon]|nr:DUF1028 domain-containing protein [Nitrososphaerales archaeon]